MATLLKNTFIKLLSNYTDSEIMINEFWLEIEKNYTEQHRYYHNLDHLQNLLSLLSDVKPQIQDWDTILFTLYYHDIIYDVSKSDNEEKSAEFAITRMKQLSIPNEMIETCQQQIIATKSHQKTTNNDTNYFTDADLSILGQKEMTYLSYTQNIRKEYAIYTDDIYDTGRKNVIIHFLNMDRIFKSDYFYHKYESQAKINLTKELNDLE